MNNKINAKTKKRLKEVESLLAQGCKVREVCDILGISYPTAHRYKALIEGKTSDKEKGKKEIKTKPKEKVKEYYQPPSMDCDEVEFVVGDTSFDIRRYIINNEIFFDGEDIVSAIELALEKTCQPKTSEMNGITLIDRASLIDLSNTIMDYSFKKSIQQIIFEDDMFDIYKDIVHNFGRVEECFSSITSKYEAIKHFNNLQLDVLHDIEKCEESEEDKLMFLTKKLKNIREQRREAKNQLTISNNIKNELSSSNLNLKDLLTIKEKVLPVITQLEKKLYNPRAKQDK